MRPTLAFVYHPRSFPTLAIAEAARDVCELLWVIDSSDPAIDAMPRLLTRLGKVVDVAGLSVPEAAERIAEFEPQGILTLADRLIEWTAAVAECLRLPFYSSHTATALADKHTQRESLRAFGLAVPGFWLIGEEMTERDWSAIERDASFPAVLKPRRGEGSRDTFELGSFEGLRTRYSELQSREGGLGREFVLEEYIPDADQSVVGDGFGGYVSVESVVVDGRIVHLAVTGRMPLAEPYRETGLFIPSTLDGGDRSAVLDVAARAAQALGVERGCLHTEIKLTPSGPVVIEVNGRMGGILPEMLEPAFGLRILPIAMRIALDEPVELEELPRSDRVVFRLYSQPPLTAERVVQLEGLNDLREVPGVDEVVVNRGPGQNVDWQEGSQGYVFCVAGTVSDHSELRRLADQVRSLVRIEWA